MKQKSNPRELALRSVVEGGTVVGGKCDQNNCKNGAEEHEYDERQEGVAHHFGAHSLTTHFH